MDNAFIQKMMRNLELITIFNETQNNINKKFSQNFDMNDEMFDVITEAIGKLSEQINELIRKVDEHERRLNQDSVGLK